MASPALGFSVSKSLDYYGEGLQTTPSDLSSPMPSGPERDSNQRKTDTNLFNSNYLQPDSCSFPPGGRISPTVTLQGRYLSPATLTRATPVSPHEAASAQAAVRRFCASQWRKHKAPILVFGAQLFGALMNFSARLLELGEVGSKLHPMQLLFFRMLLTTIGSVVYVVNRQIRYGVLGHPEIRWLLVARGFSGFLGIYGMWYSIEYMPLAEATVITFLAPILTGYWCHLFLKDPYTRTEKLASLLALGGVVLILKPASLFSGSIQKGGVTAATPGAPENATITVSRGLETTTTGSSTSTTSERLAAVAVALLGVLGGSVALTTLRAIGNRAHVLISVNYFGVACLTVTFAVLSLAPYFDIGQPDLRLPMPSSIRQLGLMMFISGCGLMTQILTTKGMAAERSNRATVMMYTNMLFAAGFDRFIWGITMSWMSATGCTMIIIGAVWVALGKTEAAKVKAGSDEERDAAMGAQEEGDRLLGDELEDQNEEGVIMENVSR
ncbi:hypothetical protein F4861DRAFT_93717 [Xylaria intraflava]|nr:hypothetical protein F4861DRAFT_93717 [Xylaria intraflava]